MSMAARAPSAPAADPAAIRLWCDVVFGYLDGLVPVRYLSETGTPHQTPRQEFIAVPRAAERLVTAAPGAARDHRAVFVVPGTVVRPGSAKAEDITETGVILVDLDHGDIAAKRDHLARHLGAPTLEVASGGVTNEGQAKMHLYWRLTEAAAGEALATVADLRAILSWKVGGDASFGSLHQPIRVPGTIQGKHGVLSAARIVRHASSEYELADLAESIHAMPTVPGLPTTTRP